MKDCDLRQTRDGRYRCIRCGWSHRKPARRNCPAAHITLPQEDLDARRRACEACPHYRVNLGGLNSPFCARDVSDPAKGNCRNRAVAKFTARLLETIPPCDLWPRLPCYAPIVRRHLIYHVYADRRNEIWRANVRQLVRRWDVFTGRRIVAVALGPDAHDLATVQAEFGRDGIEWLTFDNDPELREVWTFGPLLRAVRTIDPHDSVFYAHTKGNTTSDSVEGATFWRNAMYHHLLDEPTTIDALLRDWPMVGACLMPSKHTNGMPIYPNKLQWGDWMSAGTFFWFRADRVFSDQRWSLIPSNRYGAEAWASGVLSRDEVTSVYQPWPAFEFPEGSPYNVTHHTERIGDE